MVREYERLYSNALWKITDLYKQLVAFEKHGDLIYWLDKPDGLYSSNDGSSGETLLCAIPKALGDMLHTDIWSKGIPVILISGTLSASGQGLILATRRSELTTEGTKLYEDRLKGIISIDTFKPLYKASQDERAEVNAEYE